jgi:hypothetical protein
MWLPTRHYEALPLYCAAGGMLLFGAAWLVDGWHWAELFAASGLACLVTGLVLVLRRRGYRDSRSRLNFDDTR